MDDTSPKQGQVAVTLVLLFTAHNAMVLSGNTLFGWFAGFVVVVAASALLVQAYGAYLPWSSGRGQARLDD